MAMFFIVWGHCFPKTMSDFIYLFNVPLFFILSGFLTHRPDSSKAFGKKLWLTLIVPYLLLATAKGAGAICKTGGGTALAILAGFHSIGDTQGCSNLWFVYSLIILKLLHHFLGYSVRTMCILAVVATLAMWGLTANLDMPKWAVTDAVLAIPFYAAGYLLRATSYDKVTQAVNLISKSNVYVWLATVAALATITYVIALGNGRVGIYAGSYGNNILLYLLGGIIGSTMVFCMSAKLDKIKRTFVPILAAGNLVILTFHRELLHSPLKMINRNELLSDYNDILTFLLSVAVMIVFIPICQLVIRYIPVVIGNRKP